MPPIPPIFFWLALVLILALTAPYTIGPILVRLKNTMPVNPQFAEIPDEHARALFPPNFFSAIYEMEQFGFSLAGHLSTATPGRVHLVTSLLVNRETKTLGVIAFARSTLAQTSHLSVSFVEFSSHFEDDSEINTVNSPMLSTFYDVPGRVVVRVPHLKDVRSLYQIHLQAIRKHGGVAVLPAPGSEVEHFRESTRKSLAQQAGLGYYSLDEKNQHYRLTWKSAFRATYMQLWPLRHILERRIERKGRQIAVEALAE